MLFLLELAKQGFVKKLLYWIENIRLNQVTKREFSAIYNTSTEFYTSCSVLDCSWNKKPTKSPTPRILNKFLETQRSTDCSPRVADKKKLCYLILKSKSLLRSGANKKHLTVNLNRLIYQHFPYLQRQLMEKETIISESEFVVFMFNKMLLKIENTLLRSHRQRETTGIKKLYNSFFVLF